jgi:hypothetical protein
MGRVFWFEKIERGVGKKVIGQGENFSALKTYKNQCIRSIFGLEDENGPRKNQAPKKGRIRFT